jgi:adenosylmethionine-8-amino-7-oxononanoate aminotransferase
MDSTDLRNLDRQHVWHPFTHMKLWLADDDALTIVAAEGCELIDAEGRRYLDGVASLWCNVHGHRVRAIDDAIRAQLDRVAHSTQLGLANDVASKLAERLVSIAPPGLTKVLYASDGASATEMAFKLAVQFWWNQGRREKCEFVGFVDAYHGDTVGAMSVGHSVAFHRPYEPLLFKTHYVEQARGKGQEARERTLASVESVLRGHGSRIAAIAVEPVVMGAAGMIVQPPGFVRGLRELCDRFDVLLIADEVATGFGRTGRMFACEHDGVTPDLLCLGKGLTGGYLPLSATLTTQRIFDAFLGEPHEGKTFFHGHTFGGNPLCCAAALVNIELFERDGTLERGQRLASHLAARFEKLRAHKHVGEIRQAGLMCGIDLVAESAHREGEAPAEPAARNEPPADARSRAVESRIRIGSAGASPSHVASPRRFDPKRRVGAEVCRRIRRHGVILRPLGDTIVVMPPLVMSNEQADRIVDAIEAEIADLSEFDDSRSNEGLVAGDF